MCRYVSYKCLQVGWNTTVKPLWRHVNSSSHTHTHTTHTQSKRVGLNPWGLQSKPPPKLIDELGRLKPSDWSHSLSLSLYLSILHTDGWNGSFGGLDNQQTHNLAIGRDEPIDTVCRPTLLCTPSLLVFSLSLHRTFILYRREREREKNTPRR